MKKYVVHRIKVGSSARRSVGALKGILNRNRIVPVTVVSQNVGQLRNKCPKDQRTKDENAKMGE